MSLDVLRQADLEKGMFHLKRATEGMREESPKQSPAFLDLTSRDVHGYSLTNAIIGRLNAIRANATPWIAGDVGTRANSLEEECHLDLCKRLGTPVHLGQIRVPADALYRDLNATVGSAGAYTVGTKIASFIDMLRNRSVAFRMGVRRMPGQRENIVLAKQTAGANITWLTTETTQAAESTPTFVQIAGTPKTAAAYEEMSEKFLKQGGPEAELYVNDALSADVAAAADGAVLNGSGANGEALGLFNTSGIATVSGTSFGYTGAVSAQKTVADNSGVVNPNALGYVTTPSIAETVKGRQRFANTDSPVWRGAIHQGEIEGVPAMSSKQMPSASMIYGDWSSCIVAEWGTLILEVNPFANFQAGIVGVRCLWSMDVLVVHPKSFVAITSIT